MDETWRAKAHELITRIATQTANCSGAECSVEIRKGYPVLYNDPEKTEIVKTQIEKYIGADKVETLPVRMTTEDFAWFARKYPVVFYRIGTGRPDSKLHTPVFDVDEKIILDGTGLFSWLALSLLEGKMVSPERVTD
jgi:metal-dependent amidase/aminoacylase/carboxypeptidase family protein